MKKRFLCFTLLMVLILSFTAAAESTLSDMDAVSARMQTMTLEEKVGQLFIIRVDALDLSQPVSQVNDAWAEGMLFLSEDMEKALEKYPVGGVVLSGKNIADQKQSLGITAGKIAQHEQFKLHVYAIRRQRFCLEKTAFFLYRVFLRTGYIH